MPGLAARAVLVTGRGCGFFFCFCRGRGVGVGWLVIVTYLRTYAVVVMELHMRMCAYGRVGGGISWGCSLHGLTWNVLFFFKRKGKGNRVFWCIIAHELKFTYSWFVFFNKQNGQARCTT